MAERAQSARGSRLRSRAETRRGPRFTHEDRTATERRLINAAVELLNRRRPAALTFQAIAASPQIQITPAATLHYFGSRRGLLAAVAERGFSDLLTRLRTMVEGCRGPAESLIQLAGLYAAYALERPNLYRTIHESALWRAASAVGAA